MIEKLLSFHCQTIKYTMKRYKVKEVIEMLEANSWYLY
jgi:hypothetical protein